MPPQRKKRGKAKEKKVEQLWGWTQAAEAWASDAGHRAEAAANCDWSHDARPGAVRSQPASIISPKESNRRQGGPENTEAAWQATGRGDGAGAVGSARARLAASARSCPSPISTDTNTSPKGGKPKQQQQSTTRSYSCPPLPLSPSACPRPFPRPTAGAQRVPTRCAMPAV